MINLARSHARRRSPAPVFRTLRHGHLLPGERATATALTDLLPPASPPCQDAVIVSSAISSTRVAKDGLPPPCWPTR